LAEGPPAAYFNARRGVVLLLSALLLLSYRPLTATQPNNATVPGAVVTDPPTLHCLAFRWLISGDDNGNARVEVRYRKQGEAAWRPALPMLRVHNETVDRQHKPYRCGNLFAGSVLGLDPNTSYDVRFTLTDPDGGSAERTATAQTRSEPMYAGSATVRAVPPGWSGGSSGPPVVELAEAVRRARAGDVILITPGKYRGNFRVSGSGTAGKPIIFGVYGPGEVVIEGLDDNDRVFDVQGKDHIWFEGLTIRRGRFGIKANAAKGLVVRNCKIEDVDNGVVGYSPDAEGWFIADNVITGRVKNWYPRVESSDTGISIAGTGHVVCHNRVSKFWDCISTANLGEPKQEWATEARPPQMAIDIYNNDCSEALDDGIEADYSFHNVRVYDNRITNVHVGVSAQPVYGGPLYIYRNAIYNTTYTPFKLHNHPSGLYIVNNTSVSAGPAFTSVPAGWQNATLRNNLFFGTGRYAFETGSPDPRTTLDYNGYYKTPGSELLLSWSADEGKTRQRFATPEEFAKATGHERHGIVVDYSVFRRAAPASAGRTYALDAFDFQLKPGAAPVDAGTVVPTITDGFTGSATELGCYERGKSVPRYGPRNN
jgi:hypothetical protein